MPDHTPARGSMRRDGAVLTATCPDCARPGLRLVGPNLVLPRHHPHYNRGAWPNPQAANPNGWCRGAGRSYYEFGQGPRNAMADGIPG